MLRQIFEGFSRSNRVESSTPSMSPDDASTHTLGGSKTALDPGYGQGNYSLDADALTFADRGALAQRVVEHFKSPSYHPPSLPPVAAQILGLTNRADVEINDILKVLEQDAVLTAEAFKVASSAAYSRGTGRLRTLRDVVMRLGLEGLRNMVLEVGLNMRVFRCAEYRAPMERLRRHAVAVGQLSRIICRYTGLDGEFAYMCGLLHDLGFAAALLALGEENKRRSAMPLEEVWPVLEAAHEEITAIVARIWGVPDEVIWAIEHHHNIQTGGRIHPVSAVVYLADMWVVPMGFDALESAQRKAKGDYTRHQTKQGMLHAIEVVGLTTETIRLIRDAAANELAVEEG
ncbi:MAG: HDOD domain-containing protein [Bradymonadia bacterium]